MDKYEDLAKWDGLINIVTDGCGRIAILETQAERVIAVSPDIEEDEEALAWVQKHLREAFLPH